jgi:hypothetical protein
MEEACKSSVNIKSIFGCGRGASFVFDWHPAAISGKRPSDRQETDAREGGSILIILIESKDKQNFIINGRSLDRIKIDIISIICQNCVQS